MLFSLSPIRPGQFISVARFWQTRNSSWHEAPRHLHAGPQCAFGYYAVSTAWAASGSECPSQLRPAPRIGFSAAVGSDLPPEASAWLRAHHVDLVGLQRTPEATPRAWQLFERDGRRTQVWRSLYDDSATYDRMLRPPYDTMPPALRCSRAHHIGIHPSRFELPLLQQLKAGSRGCAGSDGGAAPLLSAETFTTAEAPVSTARLQALLSTVDVFSPNELEAASMVGGGTPHEVWCTCSLHPTRMPYSAGTAQSYNEGIDQKQATVADT